MFSDAMEIIKLGRLTDVYEGAFHDQLYHGQGKLWYSYRDNRLVYDGAWSNGFRHGRGVLTFENGEQYDGDWESDQMTKPIGDV